MNIRNRVKALRNVRAADLAPNPKNWRTHPKAQQDALRGILAEVGYADALLARELPDGSLMLVDGHLRAETTPEQEVPVLILDINEAEADKLLLSLDPLAALAETNAQALDALLREVDTGSEGLQQMYADMAEAAELYEGDNAEIVEDEIPEPPVDPITKPGDLWTLGEHRLLCGDSTKAEDVERLMAGAKAGMMVTDPPYGVDYDGGQANAKKREKLSGDDTTEVFNAGLSAALNAVPSGPWYIWHADRYAEPVYAAIRKCGFDVRALIVWNKLKAHYGAPSAHYCQKHEPCLYAVRDSAGFCGPSNEVTVWDIEQPHRNEHHPTQKPIICMARAIRNHDAESVYDPFLGSGTTLIAAEQLGRKCYGMEISPQYCDVIVKRWETLTGKKAELEASNGQARPTQRADDHQDRQRQPRQKAAEQERTKTAKR
jgi:DNA modification methylase